MKIMNKLLLADKHSSKGRPLQLISTVVLCLSILIPRTYFPQVLEAREGDQLMDYIGIHVLPDTTTIKVNLIGHGLALGAITDALAGNPEYVQDTL